MDAVRDDDALSKNARNSRFFVIGRVDNPNGERQNPTNLTPNSHLRLMNTQCKHPVVKIVSRDEDAEFVECQACGEIFDSNEFRDMAIEEEVEAEAEEES